MLEEPVEWLEGASPVEEDDSISTLQEVSGGIVVKSWILICKEQIDLRILMKLSKAWFKELTGVTL